MADKDLWANVRSQSSQRFCSTVRKILLGATGGRVSKETSIAAGMAVTRFAEELCKDAARVAADAGSKVLRPAHLKHVVMADDRYAFLADMLSSVPDHDPNERNDDSNQQQSRKRARPNPGAAASSKRKARPAGAGSKKGKKADQTPAAQGAAAEPEQPQEQTKCATQVAPPDLPATELEEDSDYDV